MDVKTLYNLTVGDTIVGMDDSKWEGTGDTLHYSFSNELFSYKFYPKTLKFILEKGTFTNYYSYEFKSDQGDWLLDTKGVISYNDINSEVQKQGKAVVPTKITDMLYIDVQSDITIQIGNHKNSVEPSEYSGYMNCGMYLQSYATISGNSKLSITAKDTLVCNMCYGIRGRDEENSEISIGDTNSNLTVDIGNINLTGFTYNDMYNPSSFEGLYCVVGNIKENSIFNIHHINMEVLSSATVFMELLLVMNYT